MRCSDLDIMAVWNQIDICEDTPIYLSADNIHFIMEMGDTKLRLVHNNYWNILKDCNEIGGDFLLFKCFSYTRVFNRHCFDYTWAM